MIKRILCAILAIILLQTGAFAGIADEPDSPVDNSGFDIDEQFDALGREELEQQVPEQARELMQETDTAELSVEKMLQLSPGAFFKMLWELLMRQIKKPLRTISAVVGVIVLCALIGGLKTASGEDSLSRTFTTVSVLCVITAVISPILNCVTETSRAIRDAALFMLSYIPMLAAALAASGSPVTGASYNMLLFSACQAVSQIVAQTLIPLMGVYLALCIMGSLVPEINIASASGAIRSIISWTLGFFLTVFVGLLSVQTMVAQSADGVTVRAAKFMIGSFVPVVGSALSEAYSAAQSCFKLIKTTLGAYGILVAAFTFLPVLLQTMAWYVFTNIAVIVGDVIGAPRVSGILKACAGVLGILVAVILCFALLFIVSTTVVMVTGMGT